MTIDKIVTRLGSMSVALLVASSFPSELAAQTLTTLHSFIGPRDGANPLAGLTSDAAGNLYGTTSEGGGTTCAGDGTGCGTVFKLTPTGDGTYAETVLYRFSGGTDGATPLAGLIVDAAGNLYGTTQYGGGVCGGWGCGTVFRLTPNANGTYSETVLYKFTAGTDGERPYTGVLVADAAGNLYGTTVAGGGGSCAWYVTCGTVFKLSPNANGGYGETVIHRFAGRSDGATPLAGLIADRSGNLYGTTVQGGGTSCDGAGCGTVFELKPKGDGTYAETVLYRFSGGSDGSAPRAGLISDGAGNLYGTTAGGGAGSNCINQACGTVFKLTPTGAKTVLHFFHGYDGGFPEAGLIADAAGNLYGTTSEPTGTVFKLTPIGNGTYTETVLHRFTGPDGALPYAGLMLDPAGALYGTTQYVGSGHGTVFKVSNPGPPELCLLNHPDICRPVQPTNVLNYCAEHKDVCGCTEGKCRFRLTPSWLEPWQSGDPSIVFKGTVQTINPADGTALFAVAEIYAPEFLRNAALAQLRLTFKRVQDLKAGDRWVVFARGGLVDQSSRLEITALLDPDQAQSVAENVSLANVLVQGETLAKRLGAAPLVVSGTVEALRSSKDLYGKKVDHPEGERLTATLRLAAVLKGTEKSRSLIISLPASTRSREKGFIRFNKGDEGIWILTPGAEQGTFSLADSSDFMSRDQMPFVKDLLEGK